MLARIKSTVRDTFIYSLSNIAPKAAGVILLPLFTAKLALTDFGNWDLIDNTIQILSEVVILGQASAIIFLNNSAEYKSKKESALFTLTSFLIFIGIVLVLLTEILLSNYDSLLQYAQITSEHIRLACYIVLLRVINNLFLAKLRADEESIYFSIISLAKTLLMTIAIIYFVAYANKNIEGVLFGLLLSELLAAIVLLLKMFPRMKFVFDKQILATAIKFGFPLIFSSLGFMLLNQGDRFLIKYLLGSKYVALYGLAYRIAGVLNMFLILPFTLGLLPVAYKYYRQPDDNRFFSKLMTYSTFFFVWGFIFISLFSNELVVVFGQRDGYHSAYLIIPIILLSYVLSGMRLTASLGMMLTKNTKHIAWITLLSSAVNILLNFIFIPAFGIIAAAINTLVAFVLFYFLTIHFSNKYFKIKFENQKLFIMIFIGCVLSSTVYIMQEMNLALQYALKIILVIAFPFILFMFKFYEKAELNVLNSPAKMIDFIKGIVRGTKDNSIDSNSLIQS